jgi:5-methyltetrahydrofolate--homocysteine methyltransferase
LNPEHQEMVATRASHLVLSGQDPNQSNYIAYTKQKGDLFSVTKQQTELQKDQSSDDISAAQTIEQAILQGLEKDAKQLATKSLVTMEPLDIIQNLIIPTLDEVGRLYQTGVTFLPQLLQSSKAAQSALLPIRKAIEKEISANPQQQMKTKQSIVVATVEGDIHDIGKNIIKTVLENYDYHIIDLGNDVSPEKILETVKDEQIKLVGLSALMTSTLPAMEKTIKLLNKEQPDCKIMVGGAVLTAEYAVAIGADYYCLNAKNNVDVAREVFS